MKNLFSKLNKSLFLSLVLLCPFGLFAQVLEHHFSVELHGKNIGKIIANKTSKAGGHSIDIKSDTETRIMAISTHLESEIYAEYESGVLKMAVSFRHANRAIEDIRSKTIRVSERYEVVWNSEQKNIHKEEIRFCINDLYFEEPRGLDRIYSPMHGAFVEVKTHGNSAYLVITPDGKEVKYTYQNGELQLISVETLIGDIISKRIPK